MENRVTQPEDRQLDEHLRDLLARAASQDPRALEELVDSFLPSIQSFVRLNTDQFLRERESCSDLVQSVCKDMLQNIDTCEFRGSRSFRNWLYLMVLNKIRMHERYYRAGKRTPPAPVRPLAESATGDSPQISPELTASHEAVKNEDLQSLERALARLPEDYRQVITLSKLLGMSYEEIGTIMNRTPEAVRSLLRRAIVILSREMTAAHE